MIENPSDLPYPEGIYTTITIKCRRLENKVWEVWCPEWKCTLHDRNLTACVAGLLAEIELHNRQEETGEVSPYSPKWDENKWRESKGFVPLKKTALPPNPKSKFRSKLSECEKGYRRWISPA